MKGEITLILHSTTNSPICLHLALEPDIYYFCLHSNWFFFFQFKSLRNFLWPYLHYRIGTFLEVFVKPAATSEKKAKVKFAEVKDTQDEVKATTEGQSPLLETRLASESSSPLRGLVSQCATQSLHHAQQSDSPSLQHMGLLATICGCYANNALVRDLYCTSKGNCCDAVVYAHSDFRVKFKDQNLLY